MFPGSCTQSRFLKYFMSNIWQDVGILYFTQTIKRKGFCRFSLFNELTVLIKGTKLTL